jgi:hypothetical protein
MLAMINLIKNKKRRMVMEEGKTNFDISNLSLQDLIKVYENINSFLSFLDESKLDESEAGNE